MASPETHFSNPAVETMFKPQLKNLIDTFRAAANHVGQQRFGDTYITDPSDIEITPTVTFGNVMLFMRMWQQSSGPKSAVFQSHDAAFAMVLDGENAYMVAEDNTIAHPLTAREALLIDGMARYAVRRPNPDVDFEA